MKKYILFSLIIMSALFMGSCNNTGKRQRKRQPLHTGLDPAALPEDPVFELKTSEGP